MKQDRLAAPPAAGRACAAFSFAGFWRENQATLLLAVVAVAVVAALLFWLARRRRQDSFPELRPGQPGAGSADDFSATLIEGQAEPPERPAAPSPGLHGKIEVLVHGQVISSFLVTDNPLPIGRDPGQALVVIQEPIVSKLHCQVFARGGQVFVKDLNSTNGVYVREEKIAERPLQDGDQVFLGKKGTVRIVYHA
ncbi:MAG TPA: FHA domain-containing protein [Candidatus Aminicenantes bacterium]|nr:FHA domain-containing protein [Candidatus Aminicenantes bacterium]